MKHIFEGRQRFSIRKFSFGAASVLLGTVFLANAPLAHADVTTDKSDDKVVTELPASADSPSDAKEEKTVTVSATAVPDVTETKEKADDKALVTEGEPAPVTVGPEKEAVQPAEKKASEAPVSPLVAKETEEVVAATPVAPAPKAVATPAQPTVVEENSKEQLVQGLTEVVRDLQTYPTTRLTADTLTELHTQLAQAQAALLNPEMTSAELESLLNKTRTIRNRVVNASLRESSGVRDARNGQAMATAPVSTFRATPTVGEAVEGPTSHNKLGYKNNPANGVFNSAKDQFGDIDFTNAIEKHATLEHQWRTHFQNLEKDTKKKVIEDQIDLGKITYNWKEKKITRDEAAGGALSGWKIEGDQGYVTAIKPELPTNLDENRPKTLLAKDNKTKLDYTPIPAKVYDNNGTIERKYATTNVGAGVNNAAQNYANGLDMLSVGHVQGLAKGYYLELGKAGTKISKEFAVNGNSRLILNVRTGGVYGNAGTNGTGERFKITVVDADTNVAIPTIHDDLGKGNEASVIKAPDARVWGNTRNIYTTPATTTKVKVIIEALNDGTAFNHTYTSVGKDHIEDGYLISSVNLSVGSGTEIITNVVSNRTKDNYGENHVYKQKQEGTFEFNVNNVGGNTHNGLIVSEITIPEGVDIPDEYKHHTSGFVWFGTTPVPSVTYNEQTRVLTLKYPAVSNGVVRIGPGSNNGKNDGVRSIAVKFTTTADYKGTATFKLRNYLPNGLSDALGNSVLDAADTNGGTRYGKPVSGVLNSDKPDYYYNKTIYIDTKNPSSPTVDEVHTDKIIGDATSAGQGKHILITPPVDAPLTNEEAEKKHLAENDALNSTTTNPEQGIAAIRNALSDLSTMTVTFPNGSLTLTKKADGWYNNTTKLEMQGDKLVVPVPDNINLDEASDSKDAAKRIKVVATDKAGNHSEPAYANVVNQAPVVKATQKLTYKYKADKAMSDEDLLVLGKVTATDLEDDRDQLDATKPTVKITDKGGFDATKPGLYTITVKAVDSEGKDSSNTDTYQVQILDLITVDPSVVTDPTTPSTTSPVSPKEKDTPVDPAVPEKGKYPEGVTKADLTKSHTRTVTYVMADGTTAPAAHKDTVAFTRTALVNPETSKVVSYTDWKPAKTEYDLVKTPLQTGYFADAAQKDAITLTKDSGDVNETVTYKKLGSWVATKPDGKVEKQQYPNHDTDPTQTGDTSTKVIPYVAGYTPQVNGVNLVPKNSADPAQGYTVPDIPADKTQDVAISYTANPQKAKVNFVAVDPKTKAETPLKSLDLTGKTAEVIPADGVKTEIETFKKDGYELVSDDFTDAQNPKKFDTVDDTDTNVSQTFTVKLQERIVTVTPETRKTPDTPVDPGTEGPKWPAGLEKNNLTAQAVRNINYVVSDGKVAAPEAKKQTVDFTRTASVNLHAKKVEYGTWKAAKGEFDTVKTEPITGYFADKASVGQETATQPDDAGHVEPVTVTVTYKPLGKIIPVDEQNMPIPKAETPIYKNNVDDPTKAGETPVPSIKGYTPKVTSVTPENPGENTQVIYVKDDQKAIVHFVDVSASNKKLADVELTGKSAEAMDPSKVNEKLTQLLNDGYKLVEDGNGFNPNNQVPNYDSNKDETQEFTIKLTPAIYTVVPNKPQKPGDPIIPEEKDGPKWPEGLTEADLKKEVTRTINYVKKDSADGAESKAQEPVVQTAHFTRTATFNAVTKTVTYGDWMSTDKELEKVATPTLTGYLADKAEVAMTTAPSPAKDGTVTPLTEKVTYTKIGSWIPHLPTEEVPTPIPYPNDPKDPTKPGTPTETIPYVPGYTPKDGKDQPLTPKDPEHPDKGYNPPAIPTDPKEDTNISYEPNTQTAWVKVVLSKDGKETELEKDRLVLTGKTDDDIPADKVMDKMADLTKRGYVVDDTDFKGTESFDNKDDEASKPSQIFTIKVHELVIDVTKPQKPGDPIIPEEKDGPKWPEGLTEADLNKEVTRTINYVKKDSADGAESKAQEPVTQTAHFTRTATFNAVTKTVTYGDWMSTDKDLAKVETPTLQGYLADKKEVAETTAPSPAKDGTVNNLTEKVTYTKIGSWIPNLPTEEVPTPIPYPNDPKDPTKPGQPTETIPYVPGYTPKDGKGQPLTPKDPEHPDKGYNPPAIPADPKEDTNISYEPNTQTAWVKVVLTKDGKETELEKDRLVLTGKTDDDIPADKVMDKIADLTKRGYVVDDTDLEGTESFDNKDDEVSKPSQIFTIKVHELVIDVTKPQKPGDPIIPEEKDGPKWPEGLTEADLKKEVTRTINYVKKDSADGAETQAKEPVVQTAHFTRTATFNAVTKTVTYGDWMSTDKDLAKVDTPILAGYLADKTEVTATTAPSPAKDGTVTPLTEKVTYTKIGSWIPNLPTEEVPTPIPYPNDPQDPTKPGTPTETIPYVPGYTPKDGKGQPLTPKDPEHPDKGYNPPAVPADPKEDTNISYEPNTQTAWVKVVLTKDGKETELEKDRLVLTGKTDDDIPADKVMDKMADLTKRGYVVDDTDLKGTESFDNKDDEVSKPSQIFTIKVHELVIDVTKPQKPGDPIIPEEKDGPKWPEGLTEADLKKEVTRTINYVKKDSADGEETKAQEPVTQTAHFTRTATFNAVTKTVTYGDWMSTDKDLAKVDTPILTGYLADKAEVAETTAPSPAKDGTVNNLTEKVTYTKIGSWIPNLPTEEVPTPIPYPNDPKDPTKPGTPTETIPYVPGYTPKDGKGQPLTPKDPEHPDKGYTPPAIPADPKEDTNISYEPNTQTAWVKVVLTKDGKETELEKDRLVLTGKTDDDIPVKDIENKLLDLAKRLYAVDSFDLADKETFDNKDDQSDKPSQIFTIKVHQVVITDKGIPETEETLPVYPEDKVPVATDKGIPLVQEALPEFQGPVPVATAKGIPLVQETLPEFKGKLSETPMPSPVVSEGVQPKEKAVEAKENAKETLPNTGTATNNMLSVFGLLNLLGLGGLLAVNRKKDKKD